MPTRTSVLESVEDSEPNDWEKYDRIKTLGAGEDYVSQVWVYDLDVDIRLESGSMNVENFQEEWTESYPADSTSYQYNLFYRQSPIMEFNIVSVDGHRAAIPLPSKPETEEGNWTISSFEHKIGSIISHDYGSYNQKLDTANIEVR